MWYLCGLGSNVEPECNISKALARLTNEAIWIWVSEIIRTAPVGMRTTQDFLNTLVVFWSPETPQDLKQNLNMIEEVLGRNRSDPDRKRKDHTIDIDILECANRPSFSGHGIKEVYFRHLFDSNLDMDEVPVSVMFDKYWLGKTPVVIRQICGTEHAIIVEKCDD